MVERRLRLREDADVRRVRSRGRSWAEGPLVARVLPRTIPDGSAAGSVAADPAALPSNRYTVVAGKKVGGAVQRNRVKRLVREAIRHLHPRVVAGHDIVVVVRGTVSELPDAATARATLERILRRSGLLRE